MHELPNDLISKRKKCGNYFLSAFALRCDIKSGSCVSNFRIKSASIREGGILMASLIKPLNLLVVCAAFAFIAAILLGAL